MTLIAQSVKFSVIWDITSAEDLIWTEFVILDRSETCSPFRSYHRKDSAGPPKAGCGVGSVIEFAWACMCSVACAKPSFDLLPHVIATFLVWLGVDDKETSHLSARKLCSMSSSLTLVIPLILIEATVTAAFSPVVVVVTAVPPVHAFPLLYMC